MAKLCNEEYDSYKKMVGYLHPAKVGKKGKSALGREGIRKLLPIEQSAKKVE